MAIFVAIFLIAALIGHWSLCVGAFNRTAASTLPCAVVGMLEKLAIVVAAIVPLGFVTWLYVCEIQSVAEFLEWADGRAWLLYLIVCLIATARLVPGWIQSRFRRPILQLVTNDTEYVDVARELGHSPIGSLSGRLGSYIPFNEICKLAIPTKTLRMATLPAALDNLSILHLSDLHFTGQLTKEYYQFVVERANELKPDLIFITGDIIDKAACLDWIPDTLGKLTAKHGIYFILGNHDKRPGDVPGLRKALTQCGLTDVGGRATTLHINGAEIHLAGNEMPWFPLRADSHVFESEARESSVFRILLSHTPDQYVWARDRGYHLVLAGHCHGGQVRFPFIGAVVSPSRFGAKYASGLFYEQPTLLHVSRGLSGTHPLRLNCIPELALLVLKQTAS